MPLIGKTLTLSAFVSLEIITHSLPPHSIRRALLNVADWERLRKPFTRMQEARSGGPAGTGLGLAIVERIATLHHAQLVLTPRESGGLQASIEFAAAA